MPDRPRHKDDRYEEVLQRLEKSGWRVVTSKKHYYKLYCPNPCECFVRMPSTPSGIHTLDKIRSKLKNHTCWESDR